MQSVNLKKFLNDLNRDSAYGIYILVNKTRKVIFFGYCQSLIKSIKCHMDGDYQVTAEWDFINDDIHIKEVDSYLTEQSALKKCNCYKEEIGSCFNNFRNSFN